MKKRTKKYKQREVKIPSIIPFVSAAEAYPDLLLELHMKILAATSEPNMESINQLSKELCVIAGSISISNKGNPIRGNKDLSSLSIQSAISVIESISDRYERTGKVFMSELDRKSLIASANGLDKCLSKVSKFAYEIAALEVEGYIKSK